MLVVVPAEPGAGPGIRPEAPLAGLPLLRRTALAAARAGIVDVRLEASDTLPRDAATAAGLRRVILLPSNVIPQPHWLRGLREMPLPPDTLWVDSAMAAVIETERAGDVLEADAADLVIEDGAITVRGAPARRVPVTDVVPAEGLEVLESFDPKRPLA
ncbi:MAG TPA: hypothetical protein VEL05_07660, partial [Candidatus Acidoferrum sp.]|nr:hypothetical protein [Candidatus Acidoferrum sp.]